MPGANSPGGDKTVPFRSAATTIGSWSIDAVRSFCFFTFIYPGLFRSDFALLRWLAHSFALLFPVTLFFSFVNESSHVTR